MVAINLAEQKKQQAEATTVKEENIEISPSNEAEAAEMRLQHKNGVKIHVMTVGVQLLSLLIVASFLKEIYYPISYCLKITLIIIWLISSQLIASFITRKVMISYWSTGNHFPAGLMKLLMIVYFLSCQFTVMATFYVTYTRNSYINPIIRPHLWGFFILMPFQFHLAVVWWRIEEKMIAKENHKEIRAFCPKGLGGFLRKFIE